jgi:hypothetical protein
MQFPVNAAFWTPFNVSGKIICLWTFPFTNPRAGPSGRILEVWVNAQACFWPSLPFGNKFDQRIPVKDHQR